MQNRRPSRPRPRRQMPWWQVALIDLGLIVASLLLFALFDHVIPQRQQAVPATAATMIPAATPEPVADGDAAAGATPPPAPQSGATGAAGAAGAAGATGDFSAKFADKFTNGEIIQTDSTYQSANLNVTLTRYETTLDERPEVYFVADIYLRNIQALRTLFADDNYGKSINEGMVSMSQRCGAIAAINSDYYSFRTTGTVIRNGVMYRGGISPDMEVAILFRDGTMKVYRDESELDMNRVIAEGAWQGFCFGPSLLDENGDLLPEGYQGVSHNPRTILGMIEPGHYLFIVIDGRQGGYSEGMTYRECAELCRDLGCKFAFNLDGGKTSQITWMGQIANQPYSGGRDTSDIIYIAEPGA